MTVASENNKVVLVGNGVQTVFDYDFLVDTESDMHVFLDDVETLSGFTVGGVGNPAGGTVTFDVAPGNLVSVTLMNTLALTQGVSFPEYGPFPAKTVERAFDRLTRITQQLKELISRTVILPVSATLSPTLPLPSVGKALKWDAAGTALINSDVDPDTSVAAAAGQVTLATTQAGIATTQAGIATTQAGIATTQAGIATTQAGRAESAASSVGQRVASIVGGTANAVTATFTPAFASLAEMAGVVLVIPLSAANSSTTPTINVDSLGAVTVVKGSNGALALGDFPGADFVGLFAYDASLGKLQLLNPASPAAKPVNISKRQTVLTGPVDANGLPNFGGSTGGTTVTAAGTLVATAAGGGDSYGDSDRTGTIVNPSWTGLSVNGTMYLYLDIAAGGTATTGSSALKPTYQEGGTYGVAADQHTYNIQEMTMKVGNGTTASQVYRVFVGEVTVAGGVVTAITWYALRGRYRAPYGNISPAQNTRLSLNHNVGVNGLRVRHLMECITTDVGYAVGEELDWIFFQSSAAAVYTNGSCDRLAVGIITGNNPGSLNNKTTGALSAITRASWNYRPLVERPW